MFTDCCGYETNDTELGICPQCLEHCGFEPDEDEINDNEESITLKEEVK